MAFIDRHRAVFGVEPICKALQVAPSGYHLHAARLKNPALKSARDKRDDALIPQIRRVWEANLEVYGADKVWRQMNREDIPVARCTIERLMKRLGLEGARRGKVVRTTIPDKSVPCPRDRVNRQFKADRPNHVVGIGFHLCLDLAGLAVCGLRHRRVRSAHRRLAGQQLYAHGLRTRRPGAGAVCAAAGAQ